MGRPTLDQWAMQLAQVTAKRATCLRRQVGCVLLDHQGHVLATGYNGVAAGLPHCNEPAMADEDVALTFGKLDHPHACPGAHAQSGQGLDACQAIHAEQNALLQCRDVREIKTCYVTASPCVTCTKLLLNTACERIVFAEPYPHDHARMLWEEAGRLWIKGDPGVI